MQQAFAIDSVHQTAYDSSLRSPRAVPAVITGVVPGFLSSLVDVKLDGPVLNTPVLGAVVANCSTPTPSLRSAAITRASDVPVDFFADPDGSWEYEDLLEAANFDPAWGRVEVGALTRAYRSFPEGAAVVMLKVGESVSVVLVDCTQAVQAA